MSRKNKNKKQRDQRRQKKAASRKEKRAQKGSRPQPRPSPQLQLTPQLDPPLPERLLPEVFLDKTGQVVPDPWQVLELPRGTIDDDALRTAFRQQTVAHPPEIEPERARLIREARDRLLDPARYLERELLAVRPPDPSAWNLSSGAVERLDAAGRLVGQAALYALLEDALWPEVEAAMDAEAEAQRAQLQRRLEELTRQTERAQPRARPGKPRSKRATSPKD